MPLLLIYVIIKLTRITGVLGQKYVQLHSDIAGYFVFSRHGACMSTSSHKITSIDCMLYIVLLKLSCWSVY